MESEKLKIFDDHRNQIGIATREEVHRLGYWHEAFHCWFIGREEGKEYIYLQIRSDKKKDYPNLLDITAAGHLLAHEAVRDGIREVEEELGISVTFDELIPLGVIEYCVSRPNFIDKELAHVFLYIQNQAFSDVPFILQQEEVSGMVRADFEAFCKLWSGEEEEIWIEGFEIVDGKKGCINRLVGKEKFVPHEISYYENVLKLIRARIRD